MQVFFVEIVDFVFVILKSMDVIDKRRAHNTPCASLEMCHIQT